MPASDAADKVWSIAQALGDIAFAFPFSVVFLEIMVRERITFAPLILAQIFITTMEAKFRCICRTL